MLLLRRKDVGPFPEALVIGLTYEEVQQLKDGTVFDLSSGSHGASMPDGLGISLMIGRTDKALHGKLRQLGIKLPDPLPENRDKVVYHPPETGISPTPSDN